MTSPTIPHPDKRRKGERIIKRKKILFQYIFFGNDQKRRYLVQCVRSVSEITFIQYVTTQKQIQLSRLLFFILESGESQNRLDEMILFCNFHKVTEDLFLSISKFYIFFRMKYAVSLK